VCLAREPGIASPRSSGLPTRWTEKCSWLLCGPSSTRWSFPGTKRAGLYLWYLLWNALGGKVGGRVPADAELAHISRDHFARFGALVDADRPILEDLFRSAWYPAIRCRWPGSRTPGYKRSPASLAGCRRSPSARSSTAPLPPVTDPGNRMMYQMATAAFLMGAM